MSPIAKKFFIASLIYLILGLIAQAVAVFDVWLGFNPLAYTAVTATEQILLVGWLTQVALALIYDRWLLPVPEPATTAQNSPFEAQDTKTGMIVLVLFNLGLPLVIAGQPGLAMLGGSWVGAVAALGGLLQLFGGLVFVYDVWKLARRKR